MKIALITNDSEVADSAIAGFHPSDTTIVYDKWQEALHDVKGVDLMFVDMMATLTTPHEIAGYEAFATAKMDHEAAKSIPLVLISPPEDYDLDFMSGWPDFLIGNIRRPINAKLFRRASTWV